jgi:hypothetical protein
MTSGLRALLNQSIDYAGMFPPAEWPFEEAFQRFVRHWQGEDGWLLSRFVCPATRASALPALEKQFLPDRVCPIAALSRGGESIEESVLGLEADLKAVHVVLLESANRYQADIFEARLPERVVRWQGNSPLHDLLSTLAVSVRTSHCNGLTIFFESLLTSDWREATAYLIRTLAEFDASGQAGGLRVGFKLRTGGVTADCFPSSERVAWVVACCRDAGLRWKATAGLHHPLTFHDAELDVRRFGFVNLFVAAALADAYPLDVGQIQTILEDESPENFRFDHDGLAWQKWRASVPQIQQAREQSLTCFGSCSFAEPRDALRDLGWM